MKSINRYIPGILLVFTIAYISKIFSKYLNSYISIEALTIAIIIGIVYNNCIKVKSGYKAGIKLLEETEGVGPVARKGDTVEVKMTGWLNTYHYPQLSRILR